MSIRLEPLKTTQELFDWCPAKRKHDEKFVCRRPLEKITSNTGHRLLVCHDLQGGYGDDSFLHGGTDPEQFVLYDWHLIDVFVYFSHNLVTVPPLGWTATAHQHGVQVLGTFITEWDEGNERCQEMFSSPTRAEQTAQQLAAIAQYFKFEGWLINIENGLSPDGVQNVLHFLRSLHQLMHEVTTNAAVIWYDAVTIEGKLRWQDDLTGLNRAFFQACDGLFVNYTWGAATPPQAAAAAGDRAIDVFMGVDVFGRGSFGGGKMNSHLAVDAAFSAGLSCALFAPGWVWENAAPRSLWRDRSEQLWAAISTASLKHRPVRALITCLPFQSSFCHGSGQAMYCQDIQPLFQDSLQVTLHLEFVSQRSSEDSIRLSLSWLRATVCNGAAYNGAQFLLIDGKFRAGQEGLLPLFSARLECKALRTRLVLRHTLPGNKVSIGLSSSSDHFNCNPELETQSLATASQASWAPMRRMGPLQEAPRAQNRDQSQAAARDQGFACTEEEVTFEGQTNITALNLHCCSFRQDGRIYSEIGSFPLFILCKRDYPPATLPHFKVGRLFHCSAHLYARSLIHQYERDLTAHAELKASCWKP